jgi:hypothetical protein
MDVSDLLHTPAALTSMVPRAGVDVVAPAGNRTPVVQPLVNHHSVHHASHNRCRDSSVDIVTGYGLDN